MKTRSRAIATSLATTLMTGLILGGTEARGQLVPIPLDCQHVGNQIILSWTNAAFGLQAAPSIDGTFTNIPGATSPYTNTISGAHIYFRLQGATPPAGMVLIPAGSFTMGDALNEGYPQESPQHTVFISAFYMDKTQVSGALWLNLHTWAGSNGYAFTTGSFKYANHPVYSVNWYDAVKWCNARSEQEGLTPCYYTSASQTTIYRTGQIDLSNSCVRWTANGYRLPTEAEWEKAARGGLSGKRFPWGDTISHTQANYYSYRSEYGTNSYGFDLSPTAFYHPTFDVGGFPYTNPVDYFAANAYGLKGMCDNVVEWCWDWWDGNWYTNAQAVMDDTCGPTSGNYRVARTGGWDWGAWYLRIACRMCCWAPTETGSWSAGGFRCVRGF